MYAVVQTSGRQFRVSEGDAIIIDRLEAEVGSTIELGQVLLVGGDAEGEGADGSAKIGVPFVEGAKVVAEVLSHQRGPKIDIYKFKRRKRYRKSIGFRAEQTTLRIQSIQG
jgi:large subunit ribosomal protein L21